MPSNFDMIQEASNALKTAPSPHMALEALLIRIVRIRQKISIEAIARRLVQLEEKITGQKGSPANQEPPQAYSPPVKQVAPEPKKLMPEVPKTAPEAPKAPPEPKPVQAAVPLPKIPDSGPAPIMEGDVQTNARFDTLVQFAAVELDGTVQRKRRK